VARDLDSKVESPLTAAACVSEDVEPGAYAALCLAIRCSPFVFSVVVDGGFPVAQISDQGV
jgi:hypothetical protein